MFTALLIALLSSRYFKCINPCRRVNPKTGRDSLSAMHLQ